MVIVFDITLELTFEVVHVIELLEVQAMISRFPKSIIGER